MMQWLSLGLYLIPTLLLLPSLILRFFTIEPFHRGYFCEDTSIKYPYVEQQTVSAYLCFGIWAVICIIHFSIDLIRNKSWKQLLDVLYKLIFGFSLCMLITDTLKFSLGRLEPYFLTVCNPNLEDVCFQVEDEYIDGDDDSDYYYPEVIHLKYVMDENCTANRELLKEARLSFVSGHSSISFYIAIFLIIFIKKHINIWILRTLLQLGYFILALWISITRINDYMHHPEDVIIGSFIGIMCAFLMHREDYKTDIEKNKEINIQMEVDETVVR